MKTAIPSAQTAIDSQFFSHSKNYITQYRMGGNLSTMYRRFKQKPSTTKSDPDTGKSEDSQTFGRTGE